MTAHWTPGTSFIRGNADRMAEQYETYYGAGHYDRRYPRPNARVMARLKALLSTGGRVLDYGCGNGRYLIPLARHLGAEGQAIGFDISRAALAAAAARRAEAGSAAQITLIGPEVQQVEALLAATGPVDLATCLFGVLSHIDDAEMRRQVLRLLGRSVHPENGRVIVSVPNRVRRFRKEQAAQKAGAMGEITYSRALGGNRVELFYKLFDTRTFRDELEGAGLVVETMIPDSVLPEAAVTHHAIARGIDHALLPITPASMGYGLLAVARPGGSGS